ncbi:MAG: carbohydrate-binding domain-containing protein, partial [Clostridia bacterium]|nr:carbohydrate-binding domain-containing protein [Clostridia bacterium]
SKTETKTETSSEKSTEITLNTSGVIDTTDMFSSRDLSQTADTKDAKTLTVSDGKTIEITEEGVYIISGTAKNCTIKVNTESTEKVQLVLDGVSITNESMPAIYVVSADKCFITTTESENTLTVTGTFTADSDTNTDAVIFSKDDIVLNGLGTLNISSSNNGISCKDDLKITGGTYNITSTSDAIEANDSIRIYDGTFTINSSKDGLHCENDDDDTKGYIFITGGTLNIKASSDGIQGTTYTQIDGGTINVTSSEGIESTYIQINNGTVSVTATDDGINASQKSKSIGTPTVEITGGSVTITMSGGDVDCIDSNGNIVVSGGTVTITYPAQAPSESFDCDGTATYTGGTIIINGEQVDSIPQSMMGGGGPGDMGGGFGGGPGGFGNRPGAGFNF